MPIIKYRLMSAEDGVRRILPKLFRGAFASRVIDGKDYYYGYMSKNELQSVDDGIKKGMEVEVIENYNDLFNELKELFRYDEQGNKRTDEQIDGVIKGILNRYGITVSDNGSLVE